MFSVKLHLLRLLSKLKLITQEKEFTMLNEMISDHNHNSNRKRAKVLKRLEKLQLEIKKTDERTLKYGEKAKEKSKDIQKAIDDYLKDPNTKLKRLDSSETIKRLEQLSIELEGQSKDEN